jgi:hypothetical protein
MVDTPAIDGGFGKCSEMREHRSRTAFEMNS